MWDFGNGETSELKNPHVFYNKNGTYIIQLVSLNEYDCYDTAYQELEILIQGLFVPNAFVPEGENPELRTFMPVGVNLRKYKIEVYNRWGSVIWSSMKLDGEGCPAEGWDGTYKGKPMPVGEYIWVIEAEFKNGHIWQGADVGDGNNKTYGTVTLIR
jgi:gliding motility-associated-like protein